MFPVPLSLVSRTKYLGRLSINAKKSSRSISIFNKTLVQGEYNNSKDIDTAIATVKKYDPSAYLPGLLLPTKETRVAYFAIRSFWIESGLRFAKKKEHSSISSSKQIPGIGQRDIQIPDDERIQFWRDGIDDIVQESTNSMQQNSTLRLLQHVVQKHGLSPDYLYGIIEGREIDVNTKNYASLSSLENHVELSCVNLLNLVLEAGGIRSHDSDENKIIFLASKHVGIAHGLTNALRLSVPTASSTGKVIIPQDLCEKHEIKSPRYLLSALGMGDEECKLHLQNAVSDIVDVARQHLIEARKMRNDIVNCDKGSYAVRAFLPAITSETFLDRLEEHKFDLTDRSLRNVGSLEHMKCIRRLVSASIRNEY